jgi:hypothetical protein
LIEQTSKGKKASTAKVVEALRGLSFYTPDEQLIDVLLNGTPPCFLSSPPTCLALGGCT